MNKNEYIQILKENGIHGESYNKGIQLNCKDINGIIHEYFWSTGTAKFHDLNGYGSLYSKSVTKRDVDIYEFISYLKNPNKIRKLFMEKRLNENHHR